MRHWMSGPFVSLLLLVGSVAGQDAGIVGVWDRTIVHSPNGTIEERLEIMQFRGDGVFISNIHVSGILVLIAVGSYEVAGNTITIVSMTSFELLDETEEGSVELDPNEIQTVGGDRFRVVEEFSLGSREFSVSGDELVIAEAVLTRSVRTLIAPPGLAGTAVQELTWGMLKNAMAQ